MQFFFVTNWFGKVRKKTFFAKKTSVQEKSGGFFSEKSNLGRKFVIFSEEKKGISFQLFGKKK